MRAIGRFAHLMSSTVKVATKTGADEYNKPTYGTDVSYKAHLSRRPALVRTMEGDTVQSTQSVHLNTTTNILATARVTLSTGDVGSTESWAIHPPIKAVGQLFDEHGSHHIVLYL